LTEGIRAAAIALYDRFTHEGLDRRSFMTELTRLAGSAAAANALLLGIAASPAAAAITPKKDKRLIIRRGSLGVPGRRLDGYIAAPRAGRGKLPAIMVIHENRGLNRHIEDVTRRIALAGYFAVAPDFLTVTGGTAADEDAARAAIARLDLAAATADAVFALERLRKLSRGNGKVGQWAFAGEAPSSIASPWLRAPASTPACPITGRHPIQVKRRRSRRRSSSIWRETMRG
jgi:carboxymethylenebutenolidase